MIIDPKSNIPIYRQIVDQIRDAIDAGVHCPGEALPSLRALAVDIRVNPNTIQRAYEELEREGVVESRRGLGVFVVDRSRLSAKSSAEKQVAARLKQGIKLALDGRMAPSRIRDLFESTLGEHLQRARNRQ